ncbi:MAG: ASKHA domain-containing protein [Anaerovoracaceae bacterium]
MPIKYGITIDIGTTNICGALVKAKANKNGSHNKIIVNKLDLKNSQIKYGKDIISRISFYQNNLANIYLLNRLVVSDINTLIEKLCIRSQVDINLISEVYVAGNTVMSHIFKVSNATDNYGINVAKNCKISILPNIYGYIGGDILAGLIYLKLNNPTKNQLFIDVGTNGEMVLNNKGKLLCASAAAGPAFEGMFDNLTGSEIINMIYELIEEKIISKEGNLISVDELRKINPYSKFITRLSTDDLDMNQVYIKDCCNITQEQIRSIQLAVAAIKTGYTILARCSNIEIDRLDEIYIAGAFGENLNITKAEMLGVIPKVSKEKMIQKGNTCLLGLIELIFNPGGNDLIDKYLASSEHIELANYEGFQEIFMNAINFDI